MPTAARARRRGAWALLSIAVAAVLASAAPALAQDEPTTTTSEPELAIFGALEDPDEGPVEGAEIEVRLDDEVIGSDTSDEDGEWRVEVPGPGRYTIALDPESLPDGVSLRNEDRATLEGVRVLAGRDKLVNFSLGERRATAASSNRVVNLAWSGIVVGLVIGLCSIGLSLVFGTTGLVNFGHGEAVTFGALIAWYFNSERVGPGLPLPVAGALAVVAAALLGAALDRGLWRPLERRRLSLMSMMIVSIGLAMLLRYTFAVVFDASPRPFRQYATQRAWDWGPLLVPPKQLVIAALAVVVIVLYATAVQRTRLGTAIRAVSDNRDLSEASGIDVRRVVLGVWAAGSALAGLGGVAFATLNGVQWDMGYRLLLPIFAAVVLGGLGTAYGALVGGLFIGLVSELSTLWFPSEFKFAWALAVLIVALIIRPQGLLGRAERIG